MDDLLAEFLTETNESLGTLDGELIKLEQNPNDPALLSNIFRIMHTIKGTCGFLGLPRLETLAHAAENVLGRIRDGAMVADEGAVSLILQSIDQIKFIVGELGQTGKEPAGDDNELKSQLNALASGQKAAAPQPIMTTSPSIEPVMTETPNLKGIDLSDFGESFEDIHPAAVAAIGEGIMEAMAAEAEAELATQQSQPVAQKAAAAAVSPPVHEPVVKTIDKPVAVMPSPPPAPSLPVAAKAASTPATTEAKSAEGGAAGAQTIRVSLPLLENLMTLVSELVLSRNQLLQLLRQQEDSEFSVPLHRLSNITSELQEGVMKTRMQPIGSAWSKLPRIVRDLSIELGKKIDLKMVGEETELDRQVIELIKDPLTHMVRNSGDHGIEVPSDRLAAGKTETGTILLEAFHEGGHIIIKIADDGKGLNPERIRQKIIEKELATATEVERMSDQQVYQYIFKAGFSTAEKITAVSGRGVGMDVVRTNIEKIGGTIELNSVPGKGTTFLIKIPLTLAIVSGLIVSCASERFVIPQLSVLELVRTSKEQRIEEINGSPVFRLRDRLLPLIYLDRLMNLSRENQTTGERFIIVTQVGPSTFGIVVDRVYDTEEIVVKPVSNMLRDIRMFSGNTILGDGSVVMILDPNGIAAEIGENAASQQPAESASTQLSLRDEKVRLLIFSAADHPPLAVQLALVARLEEFDMTLMEKSDGKPVIQYRDRLVPLVALDDSYQLPTSGTYPAIIFTEADRTMALFVNEILDIVEEKIDIEIKATRPGIMGSAIIKGKATELIDVGFYLTRAFSDWFDAQKKESSAASGAHNGQRVLLVDDSPFFRNLLLPLLTIAGYDVLTADNGRQALDILNKGADVDAIVSDIEMPEMNGFEFVRTLRADPKYAATPVVALSSYTSPKDILKGQEAGFNDYVPKFDRDALMSSLMKSISKPKLGQAA